MATVDIDTKISTIDLLMYGSGSPVLIININIGTESEQRVRFNFYGTTREQIEDLLRRLVADIESVRESVREADRSSSLSCVAACHRPTEARL